MSVTVSRPTPLDEVGARSEPSDELRPLHTAPRAPRRPWGRHLGRALLAYLARRTNWGTLRIVLPDGEELVGGSRGGPGLDGVLLVRSDDAFQRIAARGQVGVGEAWMAGEIDSPDLPVLLEVIARNLQLLRDSGGLATMAARVQRTLPARTRRNGLRRSRRQIRYHYDVGNDFYRLLLDPGMTYSCAEFEHPGQSLERAQEAKYRSICRQLRLAPGDRVLEIGCGWGGFAELAAREFGAHVTGVTLSEQQAAYARERISTVGLDALVDIRLCDYRTLDGTWDRIASIEMLEAVGAAEFSTFFATVDRLLGPDGLACVQVIGFQDREFERQKRVDGWIRRYIFPGGMLPSLTALTTSMTSASRLMVHEVREIGHHYGPTLAAWRRNLHDHAGQVTALGASEEQLRTWDYYLGFCEAGFRARIIRTMQLTLTRAMNDGLGRGGI